MKNLYSFLFILLPAIMLLALVTCDPAPEIDKGSLDPEAFILIRPEKGIKLKASRAGLTALEVVEQGMNIKFKSHWSGNHYYDTPVEMARSFSELTKDYDIPALKMLGVDIITMEGEYLRDLTHAYSVFITDMNNDTIAYIPDEVISLARMQIETAFEDGNYTEVYNTFHEAFKFLPIAADQ